MGRNSGAPAPRRTAVRKRLRFRPEKGQSKAKEDGALGEPCLSQQEALWRKRGAHRFVDPSQRGRSE